MKRKTEIESELHYISHSGRHLTVEPLASPTVAHRFFWCIRCGAEIPLWDTFT